MILTTRAEVVVPRPREVVFDYAVTIECFKATLHTFGPIPGIADGEMLGGAALAAGARRRITLLNGTTLDEDVVAFERPVRHCYRWSGDLEPPLSWLVRSGDACWTFTDVDAGTRIEWAYEFTLRTPLIYPVGLPFTYLFRGWQRRGLARIRSALVAMTAA